MRGIHDEQTHLFSYVQLKDRIPQAHPLRKIRQMVDMVLTSMDDLFDSWYSHLGRPSIPPEQLLRASLLQVLYTIRSERLLVEQLDYNLLFRWFVGLSTDSRIWDHSTFSQNRDRLFTEEVARAFFLRVRSLAEWGKLTSDEHFSVDGTLIDAWASHKSFVRKKALCARTTTILRRPGATRTSTSGARSAATKPTSRAAIPRPSWALTAFVSGFF